MSDIYLSIAETPTVVTLTNPLISSNVAQSVTVTNVVSVSVVTMPAISVSGGLTNAELRASAVTVALDANSLSALEQVTVTIGAAVSISNFPSTQTIAGTVTIQTDLTTGGNEPCVVLGYSTPGGMTRVNYLSGLPIQATTTVPVSGTVTANPAGVQTISGTVTANLSTDVTLNGIDQNDLVANVLNGGGIPVYPRDNTSLNGSFPISGTVTVGNAVTIGSLPAISGTVSVRTDLDAYGNSCVAIAFDSPAGVQRVGNTNGFPIRPMQDQFGTSISLPIFGAVTIGNSVTIGSLPAISGTVTVGAVSTSVTVAQIQGTSVTTSSFTSTTASTTLVSANSARRGLTVFNEGAGNLHICAGATATTVAYQVRLSSGDYWECPTWQTALTHSAQFSSAGTARVTEII